MAVELTKGMEGIMTDAQWLSTCVRNTWRKQKQVILIEIIFPCLLAVLLATSFSWILWLLLDRYDIKESLQLKYASFPLTVFIMAWALAKKVMSTVNPMSAQLMNYIKFPDHTEKLGYQERVISDITFLKEEISKKSYSLCTAASYIWNFITGSSIISLLSSKYSVNNMPNWIPSANLRTIVFVDDLDRCQESIILQVLSAINLVLAVCEINMVLGMDKELIQRAIMKRHGDKSLKNSNLADKSKVYIEKIIQETIGSVSPISEASSSAETTVAPRKDQNAEGITIDIQGIEGTREETQPTGEIQATDGTGEPKVIPIRELLFVRYSEGERDAFCHFQRMATDLRKLPREWKRFLTYHRLVWNIFIINNQTKHLDGWQVQLITWIFICWEFEDNINILVQRWKEIDLLKKWWNAPSLRGIVEHCIKKESVKIDSSGRDRAKQSEDSENKDPPTQKSGVDFKESNATNSKDNKMEQMKLKEGVNDERTSIRDITEGGDCSESSEVARPENLMTAVKGKSDELDKALLMKLDALEKEMQDLKELVNSQLAGKSEKRAEEKKLKLQSWRRMKSALGKYDVSMDGIQAFQRFRFYCEAGHLPWPLHPEEEETEDS